MYLSENQTMDYDEDTNTLLSTKMQKLSVLNRPTNSPSNKIPLEKVNKIQPKCSRFKTPMKVSFKTEPQRPSIPVLRMTQTQKSKKKKKSSNRSPKKLTRKKGIKLYQTFQFNQTGRKPQIKQVRNTPVSQFSGQGILSLPNGKRYEGEWVEGNMIGTAKISYPNGNVYTGQVYEYEKHGRGELYFEEGRYVGEFSGSDFHGEGILYDTQGKILYNGLWRRGQQWDK